MTFLLVVDKGPRINLKVVYVSSILFPVYMNSDLGLNLISLGVLIFLLSMGTYFSASEMAFASLNRARIKSIAESGGKRGKRAALVFKIYETRFDEIISTLLICNNIVAITSATVSVALFIRLIGEWGYLVSTVVISAVVILFTDIFPKSMAKEQPEKVALFCVPLIVVLMALLKPINYAFVKMKNAVSSSFVRKEEDSPENEQNLLGQELIFMVEEAEKDGAINQEDSQLITKAIEFNDLSAWDVLTPRVNIASIPIGASIDEIAELFIKGGYSRMPVYEDSLDTIRGIVHIRDFLKCTTSRKGDTPLTLEDIMTPALFTVTNAKITDLLTLLKNEKSHMVIVTDEYGGTEGLVTMEDILEELVGDIWDENDEIIEEIVPLENNKYKVLCTAFIDTLFDYFDIKGESESNTVCGWIMDMLRRMPEEGDTFTYEKLKITVSKVDGRRAEECVVELLTEEETETAATK